jgi:rhomboid protease GluP
VSDLERERPLRITPDMLAPGTPGAQVDFERGMRPAPPLVVVLIVLNLTMFAWQLAAGALASEETIVEAGALVRERVLAGETWRVLSAMFLHGGPAHLIGNLIALYVTGMACEHALGLPGTALVYFGSGATGAALSMAMSPGPSIGASGAIFGLLGAVIVVLYRHRDRFHLRDNRIGVVLAAWAAYQVAIGFLTPFVDNYAHLGGLAGGGVAALVLRPRLLSPGPLE